MDAPILSIRDNLDKLSADFDYIQRTQLPFAMARAATALAYDVEKSETDQLIRTFDRPTKFTLNSFGVLPARKGNPIAVVFAHDAQAAYLAPSAFDQSQFLGKGKKIRTPVDVRIGSTGNLAPGTIKRLLAQPNTFMGVVHGINGIWQRPSVLKSAAHTKRGAKVAPQHLKLLIAFTRPVKIKTHLAYGSTAADVVQRNVEKEFSTAFQNAMVTRK